MIPFRCQVFELIKTLEFNAKKTLEKCEKQKDKIPFREPEEKFRLSFFLPLSKGGKAGGKKSEKLLNFPPKSQQAETSARSERKKIVVEKSEKNSSFIVEKAEK